MLIFVCVKVSQVSTCQISNFKTSTSSKVPANQRSFLKYPWNSFISICHKYLKFCWKFEIQILGLYIEIQYYHFISRDATVVNSIELGFNLIPTFFEGSFHHHSTKFPCIHYQSAVEILSKVHYPILSVFTGLYQVGNVLEDWFIWGYNHQGFARSHVTTACSPRWHERGGFWQDDDFLSQVCLSLGWVQQSLLVWSFNFWYFSFDLQQESWPSVGKDLCW